MIRIGPVGNCEFALRFLFFGDVDHHRQQQSAHPAVNGTHGATGRGGKGQFVVAAVGEQGVTQGDLIADLYRQTRLEAKEIRPQQGNRAYRFSGMDLLLRFARYVQV